VSKRTRERDVASELIDSEFTSALEETEHRQKDRGRRVEQKTQQLCRQVQRALNLGLASGQFTGDALDDVFVVGVSAATGSGRLVAYVTIPTGQSVTDRSPHWWKRRYLNRAQEGCSGQTRSLQTITM
jgi:hypothetical protein